MSNSVKRAERVSFQDLKAHVGVDDVAYSLGYRLDRRAGVGRYFEMVLNSGATKQDTLIIRNTVNKAAQTFFRRDGSHGDVITLIKDNLHHFNTSGRNEWEKIANVLSDMAHIPTQSFREDLQHINANRGAKPFDPERYDVKPIDKANIPGLLKVRGFSDDTISVFSPFIKLISDRQNRNFNGFNIGFPYVAGCQEGIVGYEIRGFGGFKSKAAGTNSNSAAWIADFSHGNGAMVSDVYFFESAFDAMAYYQMNKARMNAETRPFALVSLGGTFSDQQVLGVIDRFPNATLSDCFDNDIAGRINAIRLMGVAENKPVKITKEGDKVSVSTDDKSIFIDFNRSIASQLYKGLDFKIRLNEETPPKAYKDWNDCLLGKRLTLGPIPSKFDRDKNLAERRKSSLTL